MQSKISDGEGSVVKNKGGRPPHEPTDEMREDVKKYVRVGIRQDLIASILGISVPTLEKHYRKEIDEATALANAAVGGALFEKAINGDTVAGMFWMKTRAGWRERSGVELSGPDGGSIPVEIQRTIVDPKS